MIINFHFMQYFLLKHIICSLVGSCRFGVIFFNDFFFV